MPSPSAMTESETPTVAEGEVPASLLEAPSAAERAQASLAPLFRAARPGDRSRRATGASWTARNRRAHAAPFDRSSDRTASGVSGSAIGRTACGHQCASARRNAGTWQTHLPAPASGSAAARTGTRPPVRPGERRGPHPTRSGAPGLVRGSELAQAWPRRLPRDNVPPAARRVPDSVMFPEA